MDDFDGPRISSFQLLFQNLNYKTNSTHLDQLLNAFERSKTLEKTESNYFKICPDLEQEMYYAMMTISETDDSALSFEKAVIDYLERDLKVNKAHLSPFNLSGLITLH